jgi:hypothetical protein
MNSEDWRSTSLMVGVICYQLVQWHEGFEYNGLLETIGVFLIIHSIMLEIRAK